MQGGKLGWLFCDVGWWEDGGSQAEADSTGGGLTRVSKSNQIYLSLLGKPFFYNCVKIPIVEREAPSFLSQMGTLGHFSLAPFYPIR